MVQRADIETEIRDAVRLLQTTYQFKIQVPNTLDQNTFYRIVSKYLWNSAKYPDSARKRISDFQNEQCEEYYMFKPELQYVYRRLRPKAVLDASHWSRIPTPRDVCAAKEMLKRTIILYIYRGSEHFTTEKFVPSPTDESKQPIHILVCNALQTYIELRYVPQNAAGALEIQDNHEKCFWKRYLNSFEERRRVFYDDNSFTSASNIPRGWEARRMEDKKFSFFRSISMAVYGTEDRYRFIIDLTLEQEQQESTIDCFSGIVTSGLDDTKDRIAQLKHLRQHLKKIEKGEQEPQEGEFLAVATFLQTDIFIGKLNKFNKEEWRVYHTLPMIRRTAGAQSKSFIPLFAANKQGYLLLKPENETCTCNIQQPEITGCLLLIDENPEHFTDLVAAKWQVCCQMSKRNQHCHFKESEGRRFSLQDEAYHNRSIANDAIHRLLKQEKRKLDMSGEGSGTFDKCIHKEVDGTEYSGRGSVPHSTAVIHQKANELGVPIFLLHMDCTWKVYKPDNIKPSKTFPNEKCRYYITLLFNNNEEEFIRIIPENGCNCGLAPPLIFKDNTLSVMDSIVIKNQRHFPMIEFFEDQTTDEMETQEIRRNFNFDDQEILKEIKQRPDMKIRNVDVLDTDNDNFFACISKEIFGNESNDLFVQKRICQELMNYSHRYKCLMTGDFDDITDYVKIHNKGLEIGLPVEDIDIVATATFLQTPIYILVIETDGSSRWVEYNKIRIKRMPSKAPERKSKCRLMNRAEKYFISLLRVPAGKYHRIIPRKDDCNCCSENPTVPGNFESPVEVFEARRRKTIFRNLYNATQKTKYTLKLWGNICDDLVSTCKKIIAALVEHRKKTNAATIAGSTAGLVGGGLLAFGLGFAPVTGGLSAGLSVIGGLLGLGGGGVIAVAKVIEGAITKKELKDLELLMKLLCVVTDRFKTDTDNWRKAAEDVHSVINTVDHRATSADDSINVSSLVRGVSGLHFVPVLVLRISFRSLSLLLAAVLTGLTAVLDVGFLAHAIYNLRKGSTTELSEELERKVNELLLTKLRYNTWAYGNRSDIFQ